MVLACLLFYAFKGQHLMYRDRFLYILAARKSRARPVLQKGMLGAHAELPMRIDCGTEQGSLGGAP